MSAKINIFLKLYIFFIQLPFSWGQRGECRLFHCSHPVQNPVRGALDAYFHYTPFSPKQNLQSFCIQQIPLGIQGVNNNYCYFSNIGTPNAHEFTLHGWCEYPPLRDYRHAYYTIAFNRCGSHHAHIDGPERERGHRNFVGQQRYARQNVL